ncbi:AarF/UbiB family protein [Dehalobacter sp. DCM]|uniref:ABC1 kinase family protein n=1 Tax=Dehalobacter sp. DCM TaxID=2907827 RepID=UPI00308142C1|nr:AarF/UbiB family protein [Dehalobacter sp. DCM]
MKYNGTSTDSKTTKTTNKTNKTNTTNTSPTSKTNAARLREMINVLRRHGIIHGVSPEKMKLMLEDLGPTFVKFGQIMSMRTDMLPRRYCDALSELRTDVKPISFEEMLGVLESEYGVQAQERFSEITQECIGSASIAQVHKAVLKNGRTVVLKVQRPGIYQTMERDIHLIKRAISLTKVLRIDMGTIDLRMFIDEMWATAQSEMDFLAEADYLEKFANLNSGIKYVTFPRIERELTTSKVLVMEHIEGIQIDHLAELKADGYDIVEIGIKLAENYVKQIVDDGLFHADPHPGNIYIRDGKIVWLDLGMVGQITNRDKSFLKKMILAVVQRDIEGLINIFQGMGTIRGKLNHTKLYEDIENMLARYGDLDLGELHFGQIIEEIKDILDDHQIYLPKGITMLGRGVITIEGVLAVCCPQVNFVQIMANHVSGMVLRDLDLHQELMSAALSFYGSAKNSLTIPEQLSNILKMAMRGQAKININLTDADGPARQADDMVDKLAMSLLCAALIIGASLISMTDITPKIWGMPLIACVGYILAFFIGGWLVSKIIRKRKKRKNIQRE